MLHAPTAATRQHRSGAGRECDLHLHQHKAGQHHRGQEHGGRQRWFAFTSQTLGNFSLNTNGGTAQRFFANLAPGAYDVTESARAEWDLTGAICSDGSNPASINLDPGESVTCTFTNTIRGQLTVRKLTTGGEGSFGFTSSTLTPGAFSLVTTGGTAAQRVFTNLAPGSYDVTRQPAGWDLASVRCSDGSDPSNIAIAPGLGVILRVWEHQER